MSDDEYLRLNLTNFLQFSQNIFKKITLKGTVILFNNLGK